MGRLFWKFFLFIFFSHVVIISFVSLTIWLNERNQEATGIEASHPARSVVEAASATLSYGGAKGLHALLEGWQQRRMPQVYAVNENGQEILSRPVAKTTLQAALEIVESSPNERYVKRLDGGDGHRYLIFVPRRHVEPPPNAGEDDPKLTELQLDEKRLENFVEKSPGLAGFVPPPRPFRLFPLKPLLLVVAVSLLFAALLAWYFSKPIRHLRTAFEEAAGGHLDTRIGNAMGSRRDELADLGRDFDSMAARLGALMHGQTRLLHHVSHELRSPLARLQIAIGLARQSPEKIATSLDRIERESERMDKLVGELLELSRLESGAIRIDLEEVDVSELLHSIVEDARFEAESLFVDPTTRPVIRLLEHAHYTLRGQPELLHRAIENIVRNALKYSPARGEITLEIGAMPELEKSKLDAKSKHDSKTKQDPKVKFMQLVINDHGPGVPAAELESIFQPFVRGSTANNGDGHGVGLAIAKQVLEAHGGSIVASNRVQGGLQVEISLPYVSVDGQARV